MAKSKIPTPDEIQKDLKEFFQKKYGSAFNLEVQPQMAQANSAGEREDKNSDGSKRLALKFDLKPKDIKSHLDRYVIKQDSAKKALAIAVCDHYNYVMKCMEEPKYRDEEYTKQNVILIGPTGVGKTYLVRMLSKLIGVPFVKADATKFSETGYVGGDVEDLARDLVRQANGNVELAQYGIIYLDEVDKLATPPNIIGRDVSGRGVQMGLLKLMEETEVDVRAPYDVASQLQAMIEFQQKGKVEKKTINTRHILFIVSGAFNGLSEIVKKRLHKTGIGFGSDVRSKDEDFDYLLQSNSTDFVKFGFEPEFIGRLPIHVVCNALSVEDLYNILVHSEGSIIKQYKASFKAYDIEVIFSDKGLMRMAQKAYEEQTGARGLVTVCERTLRDYKYEFPATGIKKFVVTKDLADDPEGELNKIISDHNYNERIVMRELLRQYTLKFFNEHEVKIEFDPEAEDLICQWSSQRAQTPDEVCKEVLKDYGYGLNLIKKNSGKSEFKLGMEVLKSPDITLERWIKESYSEERK